MQIFQIQSLDIKELQPYRTLKRAVDHINDGIFVAEGEKVVNRLIESSLNIISFLMSYDWYEKMQERLKKVDDRVKVYLGEKRLLEEITGFGLHQGIMAVAKIPKTYKIQEIISDISKHYFFVALDGLTNSDNLGVIVRNCLAFNVDALIVGETCSNPFLRRAVRQSMGAIFELPVIQSKNLIDDLKVLKQSYNFKIIASDANPKLSKSIQPDFNGNNCIVFGSEGSGIRQNIIEICDERIMIPINNKVDSLNVASASAVFLYEVFKYRYG